MKLYHIHEFQSGKDFGYDDLYQDIENFVEIRNGKVQPQDFDLLTKMLSRFTPEILMRLATSLGAPSGEPAGIAAHLVRIIKVSGDTPPPGWGSMSVQEPTDADLIDTEKWMQDNLSDDGEEEKPQPIDPKTGLPVDIIGALELASPASLLESDYMRAKQTYPFIFVPGFGQQLYVGHKGEFHTGLLGDYRKDQPTFDAISNVYYNNYEVPGAIGRIGMDISTLDPSLKDATVVSIYARAGATPEIVRGAIIELLKRNLIKSDAIVTFAKQVNRARDVAVGGVRQASEEELRKGELQVALHLGAWPNGQRLTPGDKLKIRKELGIDTQIGGVKRPWQQAAEQVRMVEPGQKWWASTSESKI